MVFKSVKEKEKNNVQRLRIIFGERKFVSNFAIMFVNNLVNFIIIEQISNLFLKWIILPRTENKNKR